MQINTYKWLLNVSDHNTLNGFQVRARCKWLQVLIYFQSQVEKKYFQFEPKLSKNILEISISTSWFISQNAELDYDYWH